MPRYIAYNHFGSIGLLNVGSEACVLSLDTNSICVKICRIRVSNRTASLTDAIRVRFLRTSNENASLVSKTAIKKDPLAPDPIATVKIADISTALAPGTLIDVIDDVSFNGRSMLEWQPIDESDYIIMQDGTFFQITLNNSTNSSTPVISVEWLEK